MQLLLTLFLAVAAPNDHPGGIDLRQWYPLTQGNRWTYQYRTYQPDGQVRYKLKTQTVNGEHKLPDGTLVKKLMDDLGWYYLVDVDERTYKVYGEHEDKGLLVMDPPFTFLDTRYTYGKTYRGAHVGTNGLPVASDVTFWGYESIQVPAGSFKNCLKMDFLYTRPNGSTFSSATYLAKDVGVVRKEFTIYSPKTGQVMRFDQELLSATIDGKLVGAASPQTVDVGEYFPFFQGDSWTYDWTYRLADGTIRTEERTRTFAGTEFVNATAAFKMVDDKGSYQFYTYAPDEGIRMHRSSERGQTFYYDPPLLLASRTMTLGVPYRWSQPDPEEKEKLMHFTSTLEGFATIPTPMGPFAKALQVRVSWETPKSRSSQVYYLGKGAGIVGMDYQTFTKAGNDRVITLDARLKKAKLSGVAVHTVADVDALAAKKAGDRRLLVDDPEARRLFREASLNRYVWDKDFRGFKADFLVSDHGKTPVKARLTVDANLAVALEGDFPDKTLYGLVHAQLSQFMTHRRNEDFETKYGAGKAFFHLLAKRSDGAAEIRIEGDTSMGSWYKIQDREVKQLTRRLGGPVSFLIDNKKNVKTEDGTYIAVYYDVTFYMNEKTPIATLTFDDELEKNGRYWVPKVRSLRGKQPELDGTITDMDLNIQFTNLTYSSLSSVESAPERFDPRGFYQRNCVECHLDTGRGNPLLGTPDFTRLDWHASHPDGKALVLSLLEGKGVMAPFEGRLSAEDASKLVAFLRTFATSSP